MPKTTALQREERFIAHYLKTLDATASAIEAGFSKKTAKQQGSRLLKQPRVADAVRQKQTVQLERIGMDAERIKQEIFALATLDVGELFNGDTGQPIQIQKLPPHIRACVKRVHVQVDLLGNVNTSIEFWDKVGALKLAAQHLALLAPKEVNINHRFPHATLTDAELAQKMLEASKELKK